MTANDLYHELIVQGFSLSVNGESLTLSPSSRLTYELRAQIRLYKAELMALVASNDHSESFVVNEVSTNGENLKPTSENAASEICPKLDTSTHYPNSAIENVSPQIEDGQHSPTVEVTPSWSMDRYAHLITCQQCEHLTATGYCRVKPQVKPMPEAMHDCASFEAVSGERVAITQAQTFTATELLTRCEESLFNHLLNCSICHIERGEYCLQGKERGKNYDDVLLPFDDAQAKRESLALRVDKALISGRSVFGARK